MGRPVLFIGTAAVAAVLMLVFVGPYARTHEHNNPAPVSPAPFTDLWPTETAAASPTPAATPDEPAQLPTGVLVGAAGVLVLIAGGVVAAPKIRRRMAPTVVYMSRHDIPHQQQPHHRPWLCTLWAVNDTTGARQELRRGIITHPGPRPDVVDHVVQQMYAVGGEKLPRGWHYECMASPSMVDA